LDLKEKLVKLTAEQRLELKQIYNAIHLKHVNKGGFISSANYKKFLVEYKNATTHILSLDDRNNYDQFMKLVSLQKVIKQSANVDERLSLFYELYGSHEFFLEVFLDFRYRFYVTGWPISPDNGKFKHCLTSAQEVNVKFKTYNNLHSQFEQYNAQKTVNKTSK